MSRTVRLTLEKSIKRALSESGKSVNSIAKESGVSQPVLQRFISGKRSLTLDTAERLCDFLGLELKPRVEEKNPRQC